MPIFVKTIACLLLFYLLPGCTPRLPLQSPPKAGTTYRGITDIRKLVFPRDYLVHVPKNYVHSQKTPLVVVLHGGFSTAAEMEQYTGFSCLADKENFLVIYPNGIGIFGFLQHWNAGFCCGKASLDDWPDVEFVGEVIRQVISIFNVDETRIYLAGTSNGGMLAYRFAAERGERIAAVATVAATIGARFTMDGPTRFLPTPMTQVPVLTIHGLNDDTIPYYGGQSARHKNYFFASVHDSMLYWIRNNNQSPDKYVTRSLCNGRVTLQHWSASGETAEVMLLTIAEWGHVWPNSRNTNDFECSTPYTFFDTATIMWKFFQEHRRETPLTRGLSSQNKDGVVSSKGQGLGNGSSAAD
jgi:polyhydroxybutyrate depolymerase